MTLNCKLRYTRNQDVKATLKIKVMRDQKLASKTSRRPTMSKLIALTLMQVGHRKYIKVFCS